MAGKNAHKKQVAIKLVAAGASYRQVAKKLGIRDKTVATWCKQASVETQHAAPQSTKQLRWEWDVPIVAPCKQNKACVWAVRAGYKIICFWQKCTKNQGGN